MTSTRYQLAEILVPGKRLGRHIHHDPRSRSFELPATETLPVIGDIEHTSAGLPLNQGSVGKCTAEALCGALNTAPDATTKVYTDTDTDALYTRETTDEGAPWPTYDPGGSGLAVCQAAKELGWITRYWHCFSLQRALRGLMIRPIMFGINWYSSFDAVGGDGIAAITPGAFVRGGHEVMAYKIDAGAQLVWFWNSWSASWGKGGTFALGFGDLERLLAEQGDVTVPVP